MTAREPVTGWFLANEDFRALCAQRDPAARRLHHAITLLLAGRLAALNAQVLACPAAEDRPARSIAGTEPFDGRARLATPPFAVEGFLPRLAFFQRCGPAQVDALVAAGRFVEARRGECIFAPVAGAAPATYVVVRGALEIVAVRDGRERRVAVLGPGQLAGFLGVLRERPHASHAFAREDSLLLEFAAAPFVDLYFGDTRASALLRDAVQRNLLAALGRTNRMLTRLLAQAQLDAARPEERRLNAALHGQLAAARQSR